MSFFNIIKEFFSNKKRKGSKSPPISNELNKIEKRKKILEDRLKDISTYEQPNQILLDWFFISSPKERKDSKEISIFKGYIIHNIATLQFLKKERIKKEKERLEKLKIKVKQELNEISKYLERENINNANINNANALLSKIQEQIILIKDDEILNLYQGVLRKTTLLQRRIYEKERQRIAEEKRKEEEFARRIREEQERIQREVEEKQRKEREKQELAAKKLDEELRQKHKEELAERERLEKLSSEKKDDWESYKKILDDNGIQYLYHFTDERNIPSIKQRGGLFSWHYCEKRNINIPCQGGDLESKILDKSYNLEDYVRLSFCSEHPMSYRLKQSGSKIVILKIKTDVALLKGTLFSDMNAADSRHTHGGNIEHLRKVNFNATQMRYLSKTDPNFKFHQAEVMVKTFVPLKYILNI